MAWYTTQQAILALLWLWALWTGYLTVKELWEGMRKRPETDISEPQKQNTYKELSHCTPIRVESEE